MEDTLDIRPYRRGDFKQVVDVLRAVWPMEQYTDNPSVVRRMMRQDAHLSLAEANDCRVVADSGRVVGLLFGRYGRNKASLASIPRILALNVETIPLLFMRQGIGALRAALKVEREFKKLEKKAPRTYDSEVVLFAVHPDYQGKGIGRALMDAFLTRVRSRGGKNVHLFSDTDSTYVFYERYGFERIGERRTTIKSPIGSFAYQSMHFAMNLAEDT